MRNRAFKLALLVAMILVGTSVWAQESKASQHDKPTDEKPIKKMKPQKKDMPKVSTEFGLGVGARYNLHFGVTPLSGDFSPKISMPVSYGAALQFRLNIGRSFGIQPEISYARNYMEITDHQGGKEIRVKPKSNIVQIPMLFSVRIAMFRLNAGPVFTLMDESTYELALGEDIQQLHLGRLFPSVTYAAGISVKFAKIMMLDVRFADQFRGDWVEKLESDKNGYKRINQWVWTLDQSKQPQAQTFRTSCRNVQVRYSIVF